MKLSQLTTTNIDDIDLFDVSFSMDRPLFIDFDGIVNNSYFSDLNIPAQYVGRIGELVALEEIKEPKHFGLGFSRSSNDGVMPKAPIERFFRYINNIDLRDFNPNYVSFLVDGMGPDTVSDSILLTFIDKFNEISDELVNSLEGTLINGAEIRRDISGHKYIQYGGNKRKLLPKTILKKNDVDSSILSSLNIARNRDQEYKTDFLEIFRIAKETGELAETVNIMKSIKHLYDAGVKSKLRITMGIRETSISSEYDSIEDLFVKATRSGIQQYGDFSVAKHPERTMQATQAVYITGKVDFNREVLKAGGNVDFIVGDTFIEDKVIPDLTKNKVTESLNQLQNYLNDDSNIGDKAGLLIIYTDFNSFENCDSIIAGLDSGTISNCRGIRLIVMRKESSPSLGVLQGPAKRFTI